MEQIDLPLGRHRCPVYLGCDEAAAFGECLKALDADRRFVIADPGVTERYAAALARKLDAQLLTHTPGECGKTLSEAHRLLDALVTAGASSRSLIVAMGGGVTGNLVGTVAALLYRGVRLVHIPTQLVNGQVQLNFHLHQFEVSHILMSNITFLKLPGRN